ncbi:MAG: hypothetical protein EOP61_02690 [Sphingomonadales bacterium]|nr:MAG: hypothetical protein EOP61_02690 [Sphingomonadales bacterium]
MAIDHVVRTWPYDPAGMIAWSAGVLQIPVLASIAWWDMLSNAAAAEHFHPHGETETHELIVPTPIEDEGERALFA